MKFPATEMLKFGRFNNHGIQALSFIHGFYRGLLYSTSSSSPESHPSLWILLVDYLGFPKIKPPSSYTRLSRFLQAQQAKKVSQSDFAENIISVVNFFEQIGFQQSQIKKVISYEPEVLCFNVDKTLKSKIKLLQQLGFSSSDLVQAILANPLLLTQRLGPGIDALRDVLGSDYNVVRILKRSRWISFSAAAKYLVPNVELLRNYGISGHRIQNFILQQPRVFMRGTDVFRNLLIRVEEKFGIPPDSASFLRGVYLACFKDESIEGKIHVYKSFGWTHSDVLTLVRNNPFSLGLSEARIKKKLDFLMNELGFEPAYLASRFTLIGFSLEKRLVPRHNMLLFLKEKGLLIRDCNFCNVACLSEPNFMKKFVEPFKDVVPDIHQVYLRLKSNRNVVTTARGRSDSL